MKTAATYQTITITDTTARMGRPLPAAARASRPLVTPRSVDIGMALAQAVAHTVGDLQKLRRLADFERPVAWKAAIDHVVNAARARVHDTDLGQQENRFRT